MKFAIVLLVCYLANHINAQTSVGVCADDIVINNFDATKYVGRWFEIERSNVVFETELRCVTATYGLVNATTVSVRNYGLNKRTGEPDIVNGFAQIPDLNKPNQLLVQFPQNPAPGKYNVWSTDYTKYTLIHSCQQLVPGALKFEMIWILARTNTLDAATVTQLKDLLRSKNVDVSKFEKTEHAADCVY